MGTAWLSVRCSVQCLSLSTACLTQGETILDVTRDLYYFTPKRCDLKRNRLDYQPGARARRPDSRDRRKSSLQNGNELLSLRFERTLKDILTAKNGSLSS